MKLLQQPEGGFRFLPLSASFPFSMGVIAMQGFDIVRCTLRTLLPYEQGLNTIVRQLGAEGRPPTALCGVELRCSAPYALKEFQAFNSEYRRTLEGWGMMAEEMFPAARTNVAPVVRPPGEPSLYAFSYTVPAKRNSPPTFVVSGAPERPGVREGETSLDAIAEKVGSAMDLMQSHLTELGVAWSEVTSLRVYTVHPLQTLLESRILAPTGPAAAHGIHWYYSRPPLEGLELEIDVRGVREEIWLD